MASTNQPLDTGLGATLAFTTLSTFSPKIREIPGLKRSVETIDGSHLGTTGDQELFEGDLIKNSPITIPILWNTNDTIPAPGTKDTATITWPIRTLEATAANIAFSCIIVDVEFAGLKIGEVQMGSITIQPDGFTGPTYTKGA